MPPVFHAAVLQIVILLSFIVIPVLLCGSMTSTHNIQGFLTSLAILLAYGLTYFAILHGVPVSCQAPGCGGWTKRTMTRVNFWWTRIQYTCKSCSAVLQREILYPDIQVEVSG